MKTNLTAPNLTTFKFLFFIIISFFVSPIFSQSQIGGSILGDTPGDLFGIRLALSGNGRTLIVGAPFADNGNIDKGYAKVYTWNGTTWVQMGTTFSGDTNFNQGGYDVAMNEDGTIIAFGMYTHPVNGSNSGKVRMYQWNGTSWVQMGGDLNGALSDGLGHAISLNNAGDRMVIGARYATTSNGATSGYGRVYEWNGTAWNQLGIDLLGEAANDQFGWDVAMNNSGNRIAVSSQINDGGGTDAGHVRLFEWDGSAWNQMGSDIDGAVAGDSFGFSVDLNGAGDRIIIGAHTADPTATNAGQTKIFQWNGTNWAQLGSTINGVGNNDYEGVSVSINDSGDQIVTAAFRFSSNLGRLRTYKFSGGSWIQSGQLSGTDSNGYFGVNTGLSNDGFVVAVGVYGANGNTGLVKVYNVSSLNCSTDTWWNGSSWSNGVPDDTKRAYIDGDYHTSTHGSFTACNLELMGGSNLYIEPNTYVEVINDITNGSNIEISATGSLVQVSEYQNYYNIGTNSLQVTTPNLASRDFMVMGSPMNLETRTGVWNSAFLVLEHDTNNFVPNPDVATAFPLAENFADDNYDNWNPYNGGINVGEGYIVRPQSGYGAPGGIFTFTHTFYRFNNGIITVPAIYNTPGTPAENKNASPNIVANPYPSAISATDFINANSLVDEVYFWEHNTPPSPSLPGAGAMNFSMEDISMFNLSGGVAAASGGATPNDYISTAQGFGVKVNGAGTIEFNNSMRRVDNNNTLRNPTTPNNRLWLAVESTDYEMASQTLIAFSSETTQEMDAGYDSRRLATVVSLFSHLPNSSNELGIQSLDDFHPAQKVSLGFSSLIAEETEYTLSAQQWEGIGLEQVEIYLFDHLEGDLVNLKQSNYTFKSPKGTFQERFTVFFRDPNLSTEDIAVNKLQWFPNPSEGTITVLNYNNMQLNKVLVYNTLGQLVSTKALSNGVTQQLDFSALQNGLYFLQWETGQGTFTDRLILK